MTRKTVASLALAAGCALALAMPAAQAQTQVLTNGPEVTPGDYSSSAARNNAESAHYDRLLEVSPGFRQARMRKECGPISDPQLRENCYASFAQYEPNMGSRGRMMANRTAGSHPGNTAGTGEFYTGSSTNPGMTGNSPGYNQGTYYGADWGGLGTTPNTPGPRPSGSGGGAPSAGR